jgi:hypothetical protein
MGNRAPYPGPREVNPEGAGVVADELARELLEARLIANLATRNRDGSIHLVAVWFLWDGMALLPLGLTTPDRPFRERAGSR